ncbi:hypothetical protein K501DRAFT_338472 [Backusella circina FSU 941]|nr:hypothetical protein K501DRAFT_338472 [Backusella circina FSU 941]
MICTLGKKVITKTSKPLGLWQFLKLEAVQDKSESELLQEPKEREKVLNNDYKRTLKGLDQCLTINRGERSSCKRLGIQCYYLQTNSNENLSSKAKEELQLQVEVLEDILKSMEREMCQLKSLEKGNNMDITYELDADFDDTPVIQKEQLKENTHNWQLTIGNQNSIAIQTDITSFKTLLQHIEHLFSQQQQQMSTPLVKQPTLASLSAGGGYLRRYILSSYLRKGLFVSTMEGVRKVQHKQIKYIEYKDESLVKTWKHDKPIAIKLLEVYFSCRFLHRVLFHQKTFWDLFVNADDPEASPVVCAVCAALLTMHCKHVMHIIPYHQQVQLGEYFFQKARESLESQFDQVSLETLSAYLHMGIYKANILRPDEANVYLEMALRIRHILADDVYKYPPNHLSSSKSRRFIRSKSFTRTLGEWETFKRLHTGFQDVIQFIEFVNNERGVPVKGHQRLRKRSHYYELFKEIPMLQYQPTPLPDESRQTVRAIMKEQFIGRIVSIVGPYFYRVRFGQDEMIPLSFLMTTEENLKRFYYHQLALDYQLSPCIFEDGIDDIEFKRRLNEDGRCDIASVTIAARFYQSQLALHEPFLPVMKRARSNLDDHSLIAQYNIQPNKDDHTHHDSDDDDNEDIVSIHALRAQEVCFKTAIIVVRLLEYQTNILEACTIPTPSLLTAWDIHMRNSCLGMSEQEIAQNDYLSASDVKISREFALRCIDVLKRGYLFNFAERSIWEHYQDIENQLLDALYVSNPPQSAHYWEPHNVF